MAVNRVFLPGQTVFHTRRDTVELDVSAGVEPGFLMLSVEDRRERLQLLMGIDAEQALLLYHRLGDWLVQTAGLTTEDPDYGR